MHRGPMPPFAVNQRDSSTRLILVHFGHRPFHISEARAYGITEAQLRSAVGRGDIARLHRGVYVVPAPSGTPPTPAAALADLGTVRAAIAGRAAAELHQLPFIAPRGTADDLAGVEIMIHEDDATKLGRRVSGAILRPVRDLPPDITQVNGLPVTSLLHTAIDVARMGTRSSPRPRAKALPFPESLVPLDAATARCGAETPRDAAKLIRALRPRFRYGPGIRTVDLALGYLDPSAESALESWSRGYMIEYAVPAPLTQQVVVGADGLEYRVDFCWPGARVIGEADGLDKYGDTPHAVRQAKRAEADRQRALEEAGWVVIRWGWEDIARHPERVMRAIKATLRRAA